jgi:hypothetical protein
MSKEVAPESLIDELKRLRQEYFSMKEMTGKMQGILPWVNHKYHCPLFIDESSKKDCNCGLSEYLSTSPTSK